MTTIKFVEAAEAHFGIGLVEAGERARFRCHMTKAAQVEVIGRYVGRARFIFWKDEKTGALRWRCVRKLCFGTDYETVSEGVLDARAVA